MTVAAHPLCIRCANVSNLGLTKEFTTSYLNSIEADLVHYSVMPQHCNPMKVAKRLWLKATALHDDETLRTLYPLFSSPACALAQICAESEVIRAMCRSLPPERVLANIERVINQTLAFSKRVKSQLASAGSNRASAMRPTITRYSTLRKEYLYQSGLRQKVDACLDPIFDDIWAEVQRYVRVRPYRVLSPTHECGHAIDSIACW